MGNFQGRKLSRIGREGAFHEENFRGMLTGRIEFHGENFHGWRENPEIRESFLPLKVSRYTIVIDYYHTIHKSCLL